MNAAQLAMIAQTLDESSAFVDRTGGVFTWPRETRRALANEVMRLLDGYDIPLPSPTTTPVAEAQEANVNG